MARSSIDPLLRDVSPFSECTSRERRVLARLVTTATVPDGDVLMRQGDRDTGLVVVVSGTATVHRDDEVIATLSRGAVVGEMSMLVDAPRTATVIASSPMVLATFAPGSFPGVLDDCPTLARAVLRTAIERLAPAA